MVVTTGKSLYKVEIRKDGNSCMKTLLNSFPPKILSQLFLLLLSNSPSKFSHLPLFYFLNCSRNSSLNHEAWHLVSKPVILGCDSASEQAWLNSDQTKKVDWMARAPNWNNWRITWKRWSLECPKLRRRCPKAERRCEWFVMNCERTWRHLRMEFKEKLAEA